MVKGINVDIDSKAKYIIDILINNGFEGYLVGGCVRDMLIGSMNNSIPNVNDWDICTNAKVEEVIELFKDREGLNVIETGIKHGTVVVMIPDSKIGLDSVEVTGYEITTYRVDGKYSDGRHPDGVKFTSSLTEDLLRRDFTINAMAYNGRDDVVGVENSLLDLENGIIRCVGNPYERMYEDSLRILRAMRFKAKLGYKIEEDTKEAMLYLKDELSNVSEERKITELSKILTGKYREEVLLEYKDILIELIPELDETDGFEQNSNHHVYDVYTHMIKAVGSLEDCEDIAVLLATLLHDIGKPKTYSFNEETKQGHFYGHAEVGAEMIEGILKRLRVPNNTIDDVVQLVKYHDTVCTSKVAIKRMLNKIGVEQFKRLLKVRQADIEAQSDIGKDIKLIEICKTMSLLVDIIEEEAVFKIQDLVLNGRDLIDIGYKTGKSIGHMLEQLLEVVITGEIENNKQELLGYARSKLDSISI